MLRIVVDTNLWIRSLLGGKQTLPLLHAWQQRRFVVVVSAPLIEELERVWQRPRLRPRISSDDAATLLEQLRHRGVWVEVSTSPPRCRDPKDHPVLATAIDGGVAAIVSGDGDLRADDELRQAMKARGIELWGIDSLMANLE